MANRDGMRYHYPMQISLTIPDQLAAQAESRGVPVEVYVQELLEGAVPPKTAGSQRSPQEIEAFFEAMAEGSARLPALPTESFSRESFYEAGDRSRGLVEIPVREETVSRR